MAFLDLSTAPISLSQDVWFNSLSKSLQADMLTACTPRLLGVDQRAFFQEQAPNKRGDGFYVLIDGGLQVYATTSAGREAVLSVIRPGQWFGELSLLDRMPRECDVRATTPSTLGIIDGEGFQRLMHNPEFVAKVAELVSVHARLYMSILEDFLLRSARARTARRLLLLSRGDNLRALRSLREVNVSHETLASMLGMTRQTLRHQLRALVDAGAISQGYGRIEIASDVALLIEASAG